MSPVTEPVTYELRFDCPPDCCAYATELLGGLPGVDSVMEQYDDAEVEQPYQVCVYSQHPATEALVRQVLQQDDRLAPVIGPVSVATLTQQDWAEAWKAYWQVDRITPGLTICPSWHQYTPQSGDEVVLWLDPGSAFGTGAHETTRLMLRAVEQESRRLRETDRPLSLLDVGTGSGILALAAARLGFAPVWAGDIDAHAVAVAADNAQRNGVAPAITFWTGQLTDQPVQPVDVITANILGPVLLALLPAFQQRLAPGGVLWLSGLVANSAETLTQALEQAGFQAVEAVQENQWYALRAFWPGPTSNDPRP